ncbi:CBO0543 family protein [Effusibacillus pohliae]|uniref:CBO0543 family protein n=1 Tax=Effusibacillus pohliae TaxID=232270 RepID=UPI00035FD31F|nr:CBO0543 family protein [Effusibacillus pohliae]
MNIGWNIETYLNLSLLIIGLAGSILIAAKDWKSYAVLFLISGVAGNIFCYLFLKIGFYSFPYRLIPGISKMPVFEILTIVPSLVLFAVRYSPVEWKWKIPFYWALVHIVVSFELFAETQTRLIKYEFAWDIFDSYATWWIFLLVFEWVGGMMVPEESRTPLKNELFRYGQPVWTILHVVLMLSIFMFGFYTGWVVSRAH